MKLTDDEKLILLMLSEIYEKLDVYGETDPKFVRSTILDDMLWGLTWRYSGIPFDPTWTAGRDFAIENGRNAGG
jgi:uncharacterized protein